MWRRRVFFTVVVRSIYFGTNTTYTNKGILEDYTKGRSLKKQAVRRHQPSQIPEFVDPVRSSIHGPYFDCPSWLISLVPKKRSIAG
jgi:hypothetical protein